MAALAQVCDLSLVALGGARPAQMKACQLAAWGAAFSKNAKRDFSKAERYYRRACDLGSDDACVGAKGAACIVQTWSPQRRAPEMDQWCNHGVPPDRWYSRAYRPLDPTQRVESDACFAPLHNATCTGVNVGPAAGIKLPGGQELKSAFCCHGERP